MLGLSVLCARYLSQVRMTRATAVGLAAANTMLAAVGSLAVAPGTTDAFAYWVAGDSGIVDRGHLLHPRAGIRPHRPGPRPGGADGRPAGDRRRHFRRAVGVHPDQPGHRRRGGGRHAGGVPEPVQPHRVPAGRVPRAATASGPGRGDQPRRQRGPGKRATRRGTRARTRSSRAKRRIRRCG